MPYTLPFHEMITIYKYNKVDFLTFVSHLVASDLELHANVSILNKKRNANMFLGMYD